MQKTLKVMTKYNHCMIVLIRKLFSIQSCSFNAHQSGSRDGLGMGIMLVHQRHALEALAHIV